MARIYTPKYLKEQTEVPDEIMPFVLAGPRTLPGESEDDFFCLFDMMVLEVMPDAEIEWLWTIDLTWSLFEMQRYRRWKDAIILTGRSEALERALVRTNPAAAELGVTPSIRAMARSDSKVLQTNPNDRALNDRLNRQGYDDVTINAEAFIHSAAAIAVVEKFLASARHNAVATLREVKLHREFAKRAKEAHKLFLAREAAEAIQSPAPSDPDQAGKAN